MRISVFKANGSLLPFDEVAISISKPTMKASAGVLAQLVERLNGINVRLIFSLYPHLI